MGFSTAASNANSQLQAVGPPPQIAFVANRGGFGLLRGSARSRTRSQAVRSPPGTPMTLVLDQVRECAKSARSVPCSTRLGPFFSGKVPHRGRQSKPSALGDSRTLAESTRPAEASPDEMGEVSIFFGEVFFLLCSEKAIPAMPSRDQIAREVGSGTAGDRSTKLPAAASPAMDPLVVQYSVEMRSISAPGTEELFAPKNSLTSSELP